MDFRIDADGVTLAGEEAGEGAPVVLLHGLTATRRYVVMGSRALERSGHRVVAYDARAHGQSDRPRDPQDYGYERLADDLLAVLDDRGIERAVLAGASMGAHTLDRVRARPPRARRRPRDHDPGLRPRGPPTRRDGPLGPRSPKGLRDGGVEGFVEAYGTPERARAVARDDRPRPAPAALRPRAPRRARRRAAGRPALAPVRGLGASSRAIDAPTVIVASRDEVDPEHPYAIGERYAEAIPGARLRLRGARATRRWPGRARRSRR